VKQQKNNRFRACSLVHNILRVRGQVETFGWDFNELTSKNSR